MAKHDIYFTMPQKIVLNKDVEFEIYSNEVKSGTLKISKGSIKWVPVNRSYGHHLSWEEFDELMQKEGQR